jgi:hypothetical protein
VIARAMGRHGASQVRPSRARSLVIAAIKPRMGDRLFSALAFSTLAES